MQDDKTIKLIEQKALEAYRRELLGDINKMIKSDNSARYIYNELTRLFGTLDATESILNERFPTFDDIPF